MTEDFNDSLGLIQFMGVGSDEGKEKQSSKNLKPPMEPSENQTVKSVSAKKDGKPVEKTNIDMTKSIEEKLEKEREAFKEKVRAEALKKRQEIKNQALENEKEELLRKRISEEKEKQKKLLEEKRKHELKKEELIKEEKARKEAFSKQETNKEKLEK